MKVRSERARLYSLALLVLSSFVTASNASASGSGVIPLFPDPVIHLGKGTASVAADDFNGDGIKDLAVAEFSSNEVSILLGRGDGTFAAELRFSTGSGPIMILTADINADGKADLVVMNHSSNDLSFLLGQGDGTFAPEIRMPVDQVPMAIAVGDFNLDGNQDLVVGGQINPPYGPGTLSVLLGNGDGTFVPGYTFTGGFEVTALAVADFDGDHILDLVVAHRDVDYSGANPGGTSGNVSVLAGDGAGGFYNPTFTSIAIFTRGSPQAIAVSDFNGDGVLDLAAADPLTNEVDVVFGYGGGLIYFSGFTSMQVGTNPVAMATGDFNGDGKVDLEVVNSGSSDVSILLNSGDGKFEPQRRFLTLGSYPLSSATGDFNSDGKVDLAVVNSGSDTLAILEGGGDGSLSPQPAFSPDVTCYPVNLLVADFNSDGRTDLAFANCPSRVTFLLGKGDGTFDQENMYFPFSSYGNQLSAVVGDFNDDGKEDLAVLAGGSFASTVLVFPGVGDGTFGTPSSFGGGQYARSITTGDFNKDGKTDLLVLYEGAYYSEPSSLSVFLGSGDGTFGPPVSTPLTLRRDSVTVGDFNGDGVPDLAVQSFQNGDLSIMRGLGDGTFGPEGFVAELAFFSPSLAVADLNGDLKQDLIAVTDGYQFLPSPSGFVSVFLNKGDGTFERRFFTAGDGSSSVAIGDFDADGRLDLAVTNRRSNDVSILLGMGDGSFSAQSRFGGGTYPDSITTADLNGDGRQDLIMFNQTHLAILLNQGPFPNKAPVAVAKADARVECTSPSGAVVNLDGSGSSDPDSTPGTNDDIKKFEWFENFGTPSQTLLGSGQHLTVTLALGQHVVTLQVTDSRGANGTAQATVAVVDTTPPVVSCPGVGPMECSAPGGSPVTLMSTATDTCSPTVTVTNSRTGGGASASGFYALGTTSVTFTATDASGNAATCASSVQVRDTTPPVLSLTLSPTTLWPPNHRLVPVQAAWQVSDICDPAANAVLASATSSEPDDAPGSGDGDTTGDIQDASIGAPDTTVLLRAERSGDGPGRVYSLTYSARDASGNTTVALGVVTVPHDMRAGSVASGGPRAYHRPGGSSQPKPPDTRPRAPV